MCKRDKCVYEEGNGATCSDCECAGCGCPEWMCSCGVWLDPEREQLEAQQAAAMEDEEVEDE